MITLTDEVDNIFEFQDADYVLKNISKRPVAYHGIFTRIGGGAGAGVFLSQAWYWTPRVTSNPDGWFYKTAKQWEEETGLKRSELEGARDELLKRGLIEKENRGFQNKCHYRVRVDRVVALITGEESYTPVMTAGMKKRIDNLKNRGANRRAESSAAKTVELSTCKTDDGSATKQNENPQSKFVEIPSSYNREYSETTSKSTSETTSKEYQHFPVSNETAKEADKEDANASKALREVGVPLLKEFLRRGGKKPKAGSYEVRAWKGLTDLVAGSHYTISQLTGCMDALMERDGALTFNALLEYVEDYYIGSAYEPDEEPPW